MANQQALPQRVMDAAKLREIARRLERGDYLSLKVAGLTTTYQTEYYELAAERPEVAVSAA